MKIKNLQINKKKLLSLLTALGFALIPNAKAIGPVIITNETIEDNSFIINTFDEKYNFDKDVINSSIVLQNDNRFSNIIYGKANIEDAGCGPISITNALILAFNINDDNVPNLLNDIIIIDPRYTYITDYMVGRKESTTSVLNNIKDSLDGEILYGGSDSKMVLSNVKKANDDSIYIFGKLNFSNDSYRDIINMIDYLYERNPNTNIIFYNMSAGMLSLGKPFGSKSESGHYITLLINVKEFKDNNTIYIIDSIAKNLNGETNHKVNYNFVEKPNQTRSKVLVESFNISRINEGVIKLTGKKEIDNKCLSYLGLEGGCGVIICPNNLTKELNIKGMGTK